MDDLNESGSAVEKYFFTPLYFPRSYWGVFRWWESRRLFYNLSVGAAGVVTLAAGFALSALPPHMMNAFPPWPLVAIYALLANVAYTLGAPTDLILRRFIGARGAAVGQALFRYGFAFSIGLTLLPIPMMAIGTLLRWLFP